MRLTRVIVSITMVMMLLAACSGAGTMAPPTDPAGTVAPRTAAPTEPTGGAVRIDVTLTDALRIEPATIHVPAARAVTFVVTNAGVLDHEFFVGDEDEQAGHEQDMATMGGMAHDEPMGIAVAPGQTKELTVTFPQAGSTLAGCHVAGHYLGGMKATIEIGD